MIIVWFSKIQIKNPPLLYFGHRLGSYWQARVEYLEQVGLSFEYFLKRSIYFVLASAHFNFKAPVFMGDVLEISGHVKKFGNSSITLIQKIRNPKSDLEILNAEITAVFLDGNNKPVPVPEDFRKTFG